MGSRAVVGDDGGDPAGGGALEGVDHDQKLHQMVIDRLAGGLHHEHIAAADGLIDGAGDFAVGELRDLAVAQLFAQLPADALSKGTVGIGGENLDFFTVRNHLNLPLCNRKLVGEIM